MVKRSKGIKIATIGGGSSYTPELIEGYIKRKDELPIKEIWLVDIEEGKEKLEIVGNLAKRMVEEAGLDWEVHLTLNRKEALKDADFVTTQFRVGLLDARIKDERIPLSYGILGQETNGAGGIFKAFRTIPVILEIVDEMKELCPEAWLVNFTNPAGMVTEAAMKYGNYEKVVGLCNVPIGHNMMESKILGKKPEELRFIYAGINHHHWHRIYDKNGKELTTEVIDKLFSNNSNIMENIKFIPFIEEQIRDLEMLPCAYHQYYYLTDDMVKKELEEFAKNSTRAEVVKKLEDELFEIYKDPNLKHKPEQLSKRGGAYYSDAACELISSIYNDKRTDMVVSTKNNGALTDLPYDCVVEVSSIITASGPQPLNFGKFKPAQRGLLQLMKAMEEITIEAAVTGDYGKALQAFILNPLIPSGTIAKKLLNEMLIAHKKYLPQFKEVIEKIEKYS
ncbi:6-phospho-beta-glucosidase [Anaerobranca californiensis DSM 14826]|jgi:6-phospho-beta-glucosidase|uniref:6-phospho-beta-glucosidase n=1 Tax=Anaerobranca californiensis DSM 14826 TaxID=1120989 RepID=A0A1M6QVB8_9FIRM|nr:6-phospho-beta-glucosidase [Anaerobranca californiensis]SHK24146.1 6-phospho-beta-glucosidase [Anaerobranca californiensis DSM 14826]